MTEWLLRFLRGDKPSFGTADEPESDGGPYAKVAYLSPSELEYCQQVKATIWILIGCLHLRKSLATAWLVR